MQAVRLTCTLLVLCAITANSSRAGDWPMWRHDAARSSSTPDDLPADLHLQWKRQLPATRPAWPASQYKLQFDVSYQPVVLGSRMFVGSNVNDSITAYDTIGGEELWRFYTDGPVRFAPAAADGRVYATSDDGFLYCIDATTGKEIWKVNGGPAVRPIIGNGRLVSSWPARGGVVLADGVAYFAASIWPSMGIFIHAVDAETGRVVWTNSETGAMFITHPHGANSFGSICPQGSLAVTGNHLIVPGGRTQPAVFNRTTGKLEHFDFGGKGGAGFDVLATKTGYVVGNSLYSLTDGIEMMAVGAQVVDNGWLIGSAGSGRPIVSQTVDGQITETSTPDRKGRLVKKRTFQPVESHRFTPDGPTRVFLKAGQRLYAAGENGALAAYDYRPDLDEPVKPAWTGTVEGEVWSMLAANDRLFVVTLDAQIYCFGGDKVEPKSFEPESKPLRGGGEASEIAESVLKLSDAREGYAIALGLESWEYIEELVARTDLHVIAIDADSKRVDAFRRRMDAAGVYGTRVAAFVGDPAKFPFPPYVANLIISEHALSSPAAALFAPLRPYGGTASLRLNDDEHARFVKDVESAKLQIAEVGRQGEWTILKRVGALPDAGVWTHQYGDASNSVVSADKRVKAPLGMLWFGGASNDRVLPRHGHGPTPQVVGGRLFIEGPDMLRCVDVYTGRVWWERDLPGVGKFYDNTGHQPGAGEIGSNYVSTEDHVYVVYGQEILKLDSATGETAGRFTLQTDVDGSKPYWGFIAVEGDLLVATSSPVNVETAQTKDGKPSAEPAVEAPAFLQSLLKPAQYSSASRRLVVLDRQTGETLWHRDAEFNFRHNCICVADGKLFCIDGMSPDKLDALRRRGLKSQSNAKLYALDARTGKEIWSSEEDVFGTFLNYSTAHDVLVQAGSAYRDRAKDEVGAGIVAYQGRDGKVLWKDLSLKHGGPCLLWRDTIITNGGGGFQLELLTGKETGWKYSRMYGCNTANGSEHLLTFRSGAAGFYDLAGDSGTGNLGGFKSSCTSSLVVADGVLNAPDYTRTCTCAYQNQTSLAMIHMPEAELWTYGSVEFDPEAVDALGLNLGAPGDRRDENGTLWVDYPDVGGPSPKVKVSIDGEKVDWFRKYSAFVAGDGPGWVAASGGVGIESVALDVGKPGRFTVRLHFAEPEDIQAGERVFSVSLQEKTVLENFDVVRAAGGRNRAVVKELADVDVDDTLKVLLTPVSGKPPVLSGIEVRRAQE